MECLKILSLFVLKRYIENYFKNALQLFGKAVNTEQKPIQFDYFASILTRRNIFALETVTIINQRSKNYSQIYKTKHLTAL